MHRYSTTINVSSTTGSNLITLRSDLHGGSFDEAHFFVYPYAGKWVTFFVTRGSGDLVFDNDFRAARIPERINPLFLYARFAWNLFKLAGGDLKQLVIRMTIPPSQLLKRKATSQSGRSLLGGGGEGGGAGSGGDGAGSGSGAGDSGSGRGGGNQAEDEGWLPIPEDTYGSERVTLKSRIDEWAATEDEMKESEWFDAVPPDVLITVWHRWHRVNGGYVRRHFSCVEGRGGLSTEASCRVRGARYAVCLRRG